MFGIAPHQINRLEARAGDTGGIGAQRSGAGRAGLVAMRDRLMRLEDLGTSESGRARLLAGLAFGWLGLAGLALRRRGVALARTHPPGTHRCHPADRGSHRAGASRRRRLRRCRSLTGDPREFDCWAVVSCWSDFAPAVRALP